MVTFTPIRNGTGYADRHLAYSDYVDEGAKVTGYWLGKGAAKLGLSGDVINDYLETLRTGHHPTTGEKLRQRIRKGDEAVAFYDYTFSSNKSPSMMALIEGDTRIIAAHDRAVAEAVSELEGLAATRVRLDGKNENRTTGIVVAAAFRHFCSRELDAQLHTHVVIPNLTFDPVEERWKALQAREICDAVNFLSEVYRNRFCQLVMELGYPVETVFDENGNDAGFEIREIEKPLRDTQSHRSVQRDAMIAAFIQREGRKPSKREIAVLVRSSRRDKLREIATAEVRELQRQRVGPEGLALMARLHQEALARGSVAQSAPAADSLAYAKEHLFERESAVKDHVVLTAALRHSRGRIHLPELKAVLTAQLGSELIAANGFLTTRAALEVEQAMISSVRRSQGQYAQLGGEGRRFIPASAAGLNAEQGQAVVGILESRDGVVCLQGAAGTGKTRTLGELRRGLMEGGREVFGCAPTQSAVEEMTKDGIQGSVTIARLLLDEKAQARLAGQVLFVDEAGMVGGKDMLALLRLREQLGFRMVLIGDPRQIQSVAATDSLRILQTEARLKTFELAEIQRQQGDYKQAMKALREKPAQGLALLRGLGSVLNIPYLQRPEAAVAEYRRQTQQRGKDGQPRSVLVVSHTWEEIGRFTDAIRQHRKAVGELGQGVLLERLEPLQWTEAQKGEPKNFTAGQVLVFHKATAHIRKGESLVVVGADGDKLLAKSSSGHVHELTRKQRNAFSVFETQSIEVAAGDRLMLQENRSRWSGCKATNGELVTVKQVDEAGRIHLDDGRVLPADYRQFTYGYACTAHRSQGKTVDAVIVSGDRFSRETFYVAASRGRESVTVLTSDEEALLESIGSSGQRLSALEVFQASTQKRKLVHHKESVLARAAKWTLRQARAWQHRLFGLGHSGNERIPHPFQDYGDRGGRSLAQER